MMDTASASGAQARKGGTPGAGLVGRAVGFIFALLAALWLVQVGSVVLDSSQRNLRAIGLGLMLGDTFDPATLQQAKGDSQHLLSAPICLPNEISSLAQIASSEVEQAFNDNDHAAADRALSELDASANRTVYCSPFSTLPWIALAWGEFIREDYSPRFRSLLAMSLKVGPREGWAVFLRTALLMLMLPQLADEDHATLKAHIGLLLDMEAYPFLANLFVNSQQPQQEFLQSILATSDARDQRWLASLIRSKGGDIELPEVEPRGARPWER